MAYCIDCMVHGAEIRGVTTGTSKKGNLFKSIRCEDSGGRSFEVTSTDSSLFPTIDCLSKGDMADMGIRAVAGRERSYLSLLSISPSSVG